MGRWVAGLRVRLGRKPLGVFVLRESAARGDRLDRLQGIRDRKRISFYFFLCRRSRRSPLRAIFLSTLPDFCSWRLVVRKHNTMCIFLCFLGRCICTLAWGRAFFVEVGVQISRERPCLRTQRAQGSNILSRSLNPNTFGAGPLHLGGLGVAALPNLSQSPPFRAPG